MSAAKKRKNKNRQRKQHNNKKNANAEGGCARADSEGPSMRGTESTPPLPSDIAVALADSCEEETDAGGRIPSSPQMEALPALPPRTAGGAGDRRAQRDPGAGS